MIRVEGFGMRQSHLRDVGRLLALWGCRRRYRRELLALDDRLLDDIGLTRRGAVEEGSKPFWRR